MILRHTDAGTVITLPDSLVEKYLARGWEPIVARADQGPIVRPAPARAVNQEPRTVKRSKK